MNSANANDSKLTSDNSNDTLEKHQELSLFLFIAIVLFPLLSIIFVGGFGFAVWIFQLIFGPPSY